MNKSDLKEQKTKYQLKIRSVMCLHPVLQICTMNVGLKTLLVICSSLKLLSDIGQFRRTRKFRDNIKLEVVAKDFIDKIVRSEADEMNV